MDEILMTLISVNTFLKWHEDLGLIDHLWPEWKTALSPSKTNVANHKGLDIIEHQYDYHWLGLPMPCVMPTPTPPAQETKMPMSDKGKQKATEAEVEQMIAESSHRMEVDNEEEPVQGRQKHKAAMKMMLSSQVVINWTQVLDNAIKYDTDDKEEMMRAKAKERKWCKVAEQAWWEEQAQLEAERVEREQIEAERLASEREAKEKEMHKEEERHEAECKCKAKAGTGAGISKAMGEVKRVVMDPSCTHCTWAKVICEFLVDGNKKCVACVHCNQSKGKCHWPRDGKDTEASPKAVGRVDKGKKRKVNKENN
ncbi:hypothetical protein M404DRAFT_29708 [Pisolithus tinctorius Marx 270]|uniref:Uncharacterized protein n=1 Tax=Pisolithus tinctorius Marx 270 TaxID=870435 RepID=A0A0C3NYI5_PISTI|nr:hypothetical protein M404DRAFT_29708 [Pisolithus tinctorius Marx 270]